ncbi:serine hydrolase domain-containing protein [Streptomyces sp. NPDC102462]|uniref:serine hydrolase domain-containing protein n=1 Tax=Streptomyces sp. NPDC102462 TaxID=3366178 RepID=UPI00381B28B4
MTVDQRRLTALRDEVRQAIDAGHIPAAQFALAQHGEVIAFESLGDATDADRFCLFSATKPIVASVVWQLLGEGKLDLSAPVRDLWPEFAANGKETVTLEQVLLHTCGFPTATIDAEHLATRAGRARAMEAWGLEWEPGSTFEYHATSAHWVLSELVARASGEDLNEALRARVLEPSGLDRVELGVPLARQADVKKCVVTGEHAVQALEEVTGAPVDSAVMEASFTSTLGFANDPGTLALGVPGANAVSDAAGLAMFYQRVLHNPDDVWRPDILRVATSEIRNALPSGMVKNAHANRTIGMCLAGSDSHDIEIPSRGITLSLRLFGLTASARTFGHGGFGGQAGWADPETGLSFAFLTNGLDRDAVRGAQRDSKISSLAALCVKN